jgi:hypothetical protein
MAQPANIVTREEIEALLQRPITKGLLAECFGVTTQQFAQTRINLPAGKSMGEWMRIIYKRRSEAAAGRSDSLVEERARLAREQADRVAMENAAKRGDLAPVGVIEMMLAAIAAQAVASLEAVPGRGRVGRLAVGARVVGVKFGTLFSGGELAGVGITAAGWRHAWGVEYDPAIAAVAQANGFDVTVADVLACDPRGFAPVDALHASPVCTRAGSARQ